MLSKRKKIIILSVMAILLVATGYLNITLNNNATTANSNNVVIETSGNFFSTYRMDRTATRNQEIAYLEAIIESDASSSDAKNQAEQQKNTIVKTMETELIAEGLIKSKGFNDVVVTNTTNKVNVIVKSENLSSADVSQIVTIIKEQTGKDIDNINIIPIE